MKKNYIAILTIFLCLIIDQISKIYVKTHFLLGEEYIIFDWFKIHFTENNGMAWGLEIGGKIGKLVLTTFRIVAVTGIGYWLAKTIKRQACNWVIIAISLIFAGAIGNIIDSVFYGAIFNSSLYETATLFSDQPYGEFFFGKVVDMLYFPMYKEESFTFFNAVFNGADSFITIGVAILFFFNKQAFPKK